MRSLVFKERQICGSQDRWFRVRIMPYRTQDNHIDGVVITFVNIAEITEIKAFNEILPGMNDIFIQVVNDTIQKKGS